MSNATSAAWEWQDGPDTVTASWRLGGWPIDPAVTNSLTRPCRPSCKKTAEWKVARHQSGNVRTAWYCTRDLPSTEAPPRDAEQVS